MKEKRGRIMFKLLFGGSLTFFGIATYSGNRKFYSEIVMPSARLLDAERSHQIAIKFASYGMLPRTSKLNAESLKCKVFGMDFESPLGLAAGFDKDADCFDNLADLGFGFVEVGTVTPNYQFGNPKPRVFRLFEDKAIINRYGFNSQGIEYVKEKLENRRKNGNIIGVNLGVNKNSPNALADYDLGISELGPLADYIVINVSSPNTPGLRSLQSKKHFDMLLKTVTQQKQKLKKNPPLLVKIAPDLSFDELNQICQSAIAYKIDGLIVCNTTVKRENLKSSENLTGEVGGLSGQPLYNASNEMIENVFKLTQGKIPIIGVGGVFTGKDVIDKMKCGASLVQMYTGFVYQGPTCVKQITEEMVSELENENIVNVKDIVGVNVTSKLLCELLQN